MNSEDYKYVEAELDELTAAVKTAVFHFFCCGPGIHCEDECGQLVPAMADLARAVGFDADAVTNAEISSVPVSTALVNRRRRQKNNK